MPVAIKRTRVIPTTVGLEPELDQLLYQRAARQGKPRSEVVRELIWKGLDAEDKVKRKRPTD